MEWQLNICAAIRNNFNYNEISEWILFPTSVSEKLPFMSIWSNSGTVILYNELYHLV